MLPILFNVSHFLWTDTAVITWFIHMHQEPQGAPNQRWSASSIEHRLKNIFFRKQTLFVQSITHLIISDYLPAKLLNEHSAEGHDEDCAKCATNACKCSEASVLILGWPSETTYHWITCLTTFELLSDLTIMGFVVGKRGPWNNPMKNLVAMRAQAPWEAIRGLRRVRIPPINVAMPKTILVP